MVLLVSRFVSNVSQYDAGVTESYNCVIPDGYIKTLAYCPADVVAV